MWVFHIRCSSMQIPRNLTDVSMQLLPILFNGVSFMNTFILSKSHRLCIGLITIYLVLFAFSDNLFAQNHLYNLFISLLAVSNKDTKLWSEIYRVVSSAKERIPLPHDLWISLTYSKYSKGPKIDHWGTPQIIFFMGRILTIYFHKCLVECLALNPYWCSYKILFVFRKFIILSYIIFSSSFENEVRRIIGR